ncbi:MAG: PhpK family radical SAM P-methyltransferase [Acidobacteria bacterium]|nr:PhpK family radical SAM P-methyltransferase [Acidobacteriota bacterium]
MNGKPLDCVVIGYNELPFDRYEQFLRGYGEDSEAYRDLKFSYVQTGPRKLDYVGLLNHVYEAARGGGAAGAARQAFLSGDIPNLAAAVLTSYLNTHGCTARYINLFQQERDRLAAYLAEDPLCVAITTTFYVVNLPVNEMVEFIRRHNPRVKIVVGGPLIANHVRNGRGDGTAVSIGGVSPELRAALDDMGADIYVNEGQGEATLAQIVATLREGGDLGRVPNIIYRDGARLRATPTAPENNSLDENSIDWRGFTGEDLGRTIQTRTARSCAFNCSFCNYPTRAGKLTLAGLDTVERELDSIRQLGQVRNVVFIDDTFNVPLPRFKELCRMMIRKGYGFDWFSYFRCSNSDEEAIELMAESGCKGVFLGIESGSPAILANMNKAATIEKYDRGIKLLHDHGILTFASFIVGFPGETAETVAETVDFIRSTGPSYYRAQMWYCEPGTPIDRHRQKYQIEGEGFVWSHATMDSLEAIDHIDRMFLTVTESQWLPQWSFDFWIIPYLLGKGLTLPQFDDFMGVANKLLAMNVAAVTETQQQALSREHLRTLVEQARDWNIN